MKEAKNEREEEREWLEGFGGRMYDQESDRVFARAKRSITLRKSQEI